MTPREKVAHTFRRLLLRGKTVSLAPDVKLAGGLSLKPGFNHGHPGSITLGPACSLETGCVLHAYGGNITLGKNVHLGPHTVIYGHGGVEIGDDCLVAMHCRILSSEHTIPALDRRIRWETDILKPTRLGRDVWLGAGVTILGGVTVGDGCVVGAGAVVTRDLPSGSIAKGVPAQITGHRPASTPPLPPT